MRHPERIWVDFLNTDGNRHLRLTTRGTREDLQRMGIELVEGLSLKLYSDDADDDGNRDDLFVDGIARLDRGGKGWVAEIDWDSIRHESDL